MHISDFAIFRVTWNRLTPWPMRWLGALLNYAFIIIGVVVFFAAASYGVALGWKWGH